MRRFVLIVLTACSHPSGVTPDASVDAVAIDAAIDAPASLLGTATATPTTCGNNLPAGTTCQTVTVTGCPGIESESIDATLAIVPQTGALRGTVVHFKGGGGEGFEQNGLTEYSGAGFVNVLVSWTTDWEQTQASGIKTAACRPATLLKLVYDTIHTGGRAAPFCGQGFSGGSGQLGYALAHYGMADYLDYVNELSGPPFARIDLGCNGDAPPTATVCGDTVTMKLPAMLDSWENMPAPLTCGSTGVPADELARWQADSIAVGGLYAYPSTHVGFFDCTNNATAVTAMAQLYQQQITTTTTYQCYSQADGCQGEGLGPTGTRDAIQAMLSECTARH